MKQMVELKSILKSLSDSSNAADKFLEENASEFMPIRVSYWVDIVKRRAVIIAEENGSDTESEEIPSLMSFLKGTSERCARASSVLTEAQRLHLHPQKSGNKKACESRQSFKTPLLHKGSDANISSGNKTPKLKIKLDMKIGTGKDWKGETFLSTSLKKCSTLNGKSPASNMIARQTRSSKRKSSEIMLKSNLKVSKMDVNQLNLQEEKMKQDPIVDREQMKAKDSPFQNYANIKSSAGVSGVSILKQNHSCCSKMETKQNKAVENRKNIMALRQQKLVQSKKIREEKMIKTMQQRQILEKQKLAKGHGGKEKTLLNTNTEPSPKTVHKTVAENETSSYVLKIQNKEKKKPPKKLLDESKKIIPKAGTSVCKSGEDKNLKYETNKMLNGTFYASDKQPSISSKGNFLKEENTCTHINANSGAMKDISNGNKIKHTYKNVKPLKETSERYSITTSHSSFVNYDLSEILSDSEDDEPKTNSKPIPAWAAGVRLQNALFQQFHNPRNTDELFGNIFDSVDLAAIMGVEKTHYNKRSSSAVWSSFH